MAIVFYISGHGFGHASRQIEIINALHARTPAHAILVRTSAPRWLFDLSCDAPVLFDPLQCDTGAVQRDSLHLDEDATIRDAAEFHADLPEKAEHEAAYLGACRAAVVITDAPPLACVGAMRAGVPSYVVANFTWDWIYDGYAAQAARCPWLVPALREAYSLSTGAWRLPMWGGFSGIERVEDVPFVARRARHGRDETRRRFGIASNSPVVLVSFGGLGLDRIRANSRLRRYTVVTVGGVVGAELGVGTIIDERELYHAGFRYEDLVAAADVVVTKPGYGILSECIANGAAVLYTSRGHFREYEVLVRELPRYTRAAFIPQADLFDGHWEPFVEELLAQEPARERPRVDGAETVADRIVSLL